MATVPKLEQGWPKLKHAVVVLTAHESNPRLVLLSNPVTSAARPIHRDHGVCGASVVSLAVLARSAGSASALHVTSASLSQSRSCCAMQAAALHHAKSVHGINGPPVCGTVLDSVEGNECVLCCSQVLVAVMNALISSRSANVMYCSAHMTVF